MKKLFRQKLLMRFAMGVALLGALGSKANVKRQTTIYGKLGGQCLPLCSSTTNSVCVMASDDGVYYSTGACATRYTGVNYAIPSK